VRERFPTSAARQITLPYRVVRSRRLVPFAALVLVACGGGSAGPTDAGHPDGTVSSDAADGAVSSPDGGMTCLLCGDATDDATVVAQVRGEIDRVCSNMDGCHGAGEAHMTLLPGNEFGAMINVTSFENPPMKRVLPGDPLQSYVYLKLWCDGGIIDSCMPLGGQSAATADLFFEWIEAGAPTQ
jgi:hypothetical protein